ncbi:MAG: hypothetical protein V2I33_14730 [Kangiellaceae bacterium]|jgi:hypothetical protein|nr:hypothetical protein [Kangiellaceae bacterium]
MKVIRNKAWRRKQARLKSDGRVDKSQLWSPYEKNWKLLYLRSVKLQRAKLLGFEYPRKSTRQLLDAEMPIY